MYWDIFSLEIILRTSNTALQNLTNWVKAYLKELVQPAPIIVIMKKFGNIFISHILWLEFIYTNHDKVITNYDSFAYYEIRRRSDVTNDDSLLITNFDWIMVKQ